MSARDKNPFRPGNGVLPPFLAGRDKVLTSFATLLDENLRGLPRNLILYGLRGTGKTVLLQMFKQICERKGWIFAEREFNERYRNEEVFAEAFLQDVTKAASNISLLKKARELGKRVADLLKPEELEILGIRYKPFYKQQKILLEDHLKDHLIDNWKLFANAAEEAHGLVFFYDEFHAVKDAAPNFPLASFLGGLAHAQRKGCKYLVVVSGLPNMKVNMKEAKTYVERMFRFEEIANLSSEDAKKAIEEPITKAGIVFDPKVVQAIVKETQGYPYFLQFYGYFLIETLDKIRIGFSDYKEVHDDMLEELDRSFFEDRFGMASDAEQEGLLSMAKIGEANIKTSEISQRCKQDYQTMISSLNRLIDKNLIYKARKGKYSFTLPLFRNFLFRKLSTY